MITRLRALFREHRENDAAPRGQVLVMFALFLTSMLGMLGLATDQGFAFSQKRTIQNAADAGAMAGARAVARWSTTNNTSAQADAKTFAEAPNNKIASTDQTMFSCDYVNYGSASVGGCGGGVPAAATGVRVVVQEQPSTFFVQVIPGAPNSVTLTATATAHVQRLGTPPSDGPFIVCGMDTDLASGGNLDILLDNSTVNPAAFGKTFNIHGSQIEQCGSQASAFKGLAEVGNNIGRRPNERWDGNNGVRAGPTRFQVNGAEGCKPGTPEPYNCVMLLPVATNNPAPTGNPSNYKFHVTHVLAFRVTSGQGNVQDQGTLLEDYIVSGPGDNTWCRDCGGVVVVRMTT